MGLLLRDPRGWGFPGRGGPCFVGLEAVMVERKSAGLSGGHVEELCAELRPLFVGLRLKDLGAMPPRDLVLVFGLEDGDGSGVRRLRVSASPDGPRFHLQHGRVKRGDGPMGPFFRTVMEELVGGELVEMERTAGDRILRLGFGGERGRRALYLELFGRAANLVLCDGEDRVMAMLAKAPRRTESPRLRIGKAWVAPAAKGGPKVEERPLVECFEEPPAREGGPKVDAPLSWIVESSVGAAAAGAWDDKVKKTLLDRLRRKRKRCASLERGLIGKLEAAEGAERVLQDGELLKASMGSLKRGMSSIEVADHFDDSGESPMRTLELDAKLTPQENVERYFKRYRKLVRAQGSVAEELERCRARDADLARFESRASEEGADVEALDREAVERGLLDARQEGDPRKRKAPEPRKAYRSFRGCRGSEIRVGRTAKDNDRLSFRECRGNDLWLHTSDTPGSHVVLRLPGRAEPDPEEVIDAALLAMHFSPLRGKGGAGIWVCRCKELRKPKGAPAGLVQMSGGKRLDIRAQPDRLRGLLDARPSGEEGDPPT